MIIFRYEKNHHLGHKNRHIFANKYTYIQNHNIGPQERRMRRSVSSSSSSDSYSEPNVAGAVPSRKSKPKLARKKTKRAEDVILKCQVNTWTGHETFVSRSLFKEKKSKTLVHSQMQFDFFVEKLHADGI
jgi:hypothetical protein